MLKVRLRRTSPDVTVTSMGTTVLALTGHPLVLAVSRDPVRSGNRSPARGVTVPRGNRTGLPCLLGLNTTGRAKTLSPLYPNRNRRITDLWNGLDWKEP